MTDMLAWPAPASSMAMRNPRLRKSCDHALELGEVAHPASLTYLEDDIAWSGSRASCWLRQALSGTTRLHQGSIATFTNKVDGDACRAAARRALGTGSQRLK